MSKERSTFEIQKNIFSFNFIRFENKCIHCVSPGGDGADGDYERRMRLSDWRVLPADYLADRYRLVAETIVGPSEAEAGGESSSSLHGASDRMVCLR